MITLPPIPLARESFVFTALEVSARVLTAESLLLLGSSGAEPVGWSFTFVQVLAWEIPPHEPVGGGEKCLA